MIFAYREQDSLITKSLALWPIRGELHIQDHAGNYVQVYVKDNGNPRAVLGEMERLYVESKVAALVP